jgi:hypothetical protein
MDCPFIKKKTKNSFFLLKMATPSIPLNGYVFASNDSGVDKNYGDQLTGDKLRLTNVPGTYLSDLPLLSASETFACRGHCPKRTSSLWQRVS